MEDAAPRGNIFVTATGCRDIIRGRAPAGHARRRHRLQHRPLRRGDRRGLAAEATPGIKHTNIKPQVDRFTLPQRPFDPPAGRGAAGQPGLRHGASVVRDVQLVHQPGAGPDCPLDRAGEVSRSASTACPRSSTRKSPGCTWSSSASSSPSSRPSRPSTWASPARTGPFKPEYYRYYGPPCHARNPSLSRIRYDLGHVGSLSDVSRRPTTSSARSCRRSSTSSIPATSSG